MKEFFEVIGTVFGFTFFLMMIILPIIFLWEQKSCSNYELITNRTTKHVFFGGCFVETPNGWLTKNEYGQVIIAREGLLNK